VEKGDHSLSCAYVDYIDLMSSHLHLHYLLAEFHNKFDSVNNKRISIRRIW